MTHSVLDNILFDESLMPSGKKFKGVPMSEVPAWYLLWFWNENIDDYEAPGGSKLNRKDHMVMDYIKDYGVEELKKEVDCG